MNKLTLIILLCLSLCCNLTANNKLDRLRELFLKMTNTELSEKKILINDSILVEFNSIFSDPHSITESFDSIPGLKKLLSEDKKLAVYTWNLSYTNTHEYFGFIQFRDEKRNIYKVSKLENHAEVYDDIYKEKGSSEKWFGALYYSLVEKEYKNKNSYILMGFDFNDNLSTKKVIETLAITDDGTALFGIPIIKRGKTVVGRVIFEYSAKASMLLKYDDDEDMIVFDHLSPISPSYKGHPEFYAPDLSIDGLYFSEGFWHYKPDLDLKTKRRHKSNKKPSGNNMLPDNFYKN